MSMNGQEAQGLGRSPAAPTKDSAPALASQNIALFGPPGSGKTSVGAELAQLLKRGFVDMDECIEARTGKRIPQIFAEGGEAAFRLMESELCHELAYQPGSVIACGGGTLMNPENREIIEASSSVVFLDCEVQELLRRMEDSSERPLLVGDSKARLQALLQSREQVYQSFPLRVDTTKLTQAQVAAQIAELVRRNETITLSVRQPPPGYQVMLGSDLLKHVAELFSGLNLQPPFVAVSDTNVAPLYGDRVKQILDAKIIVLPAGEEHKTLETVRGLYDRFLDLGLERKGTVIALGGGVVGDITGFAAATYLRSVRWVNLPTSLLAMVDASVGGKVGVNLPQGKNLVGAFYQPMTVLVDVTTLDTLPPIEFRVGMAELVKAALIGDPQLFTWLEQDDSQPTQRWLERALAVKIAIVESDPFEGGERAKLNLGHTIAHGFETASGYQMRHGEAVAVGMLAEARVSEAIGLAKDSLSARIEAVLTNLGLPTRYRGFSPQTVYTAMSSDKKRAGGRLLFALPVMPGKMEIHCPVPEAVVSQVLEELQEVR